MTRRARGRGEEKGGRDRGLDGEADEGDWGVEGKNTRPWRRRRLRLDSSLTNSKTMSW